jgi:hypothetical protein
MRNGTLQNELSFNKQGNIKIISLRRIEWAGRAECKIKLRDNVLFFTSYEGVLRSSGIAQHIRILYIKRRWWSTLSPG